MNSRREFRVGPVSPMKRERRATGMTSVPTQWAPDFFSELFTHVGQWGTHVDPPAHFVKGLRTVDQIDPKEMILALVVIDVHGEAAANPDLHVVARAREKVGKRSRPDPNWSICGDADGLVETLARWHQNGKQRCERDGPLSRMESPRVEIPLRGAQNHCFRPRNDRHRSGHRHE